MKGKRGLIMGVLELIIYVLIIAGIAYLIFKNKLLSLLNSKEKDLVLSLGGGSFLDEKVRKNVKNISLSFWLNWKPLTIIKRIRKSSKRPLIQGLNDQEIKKMMLDRNRYYAKSDFKIDCDNHKKNEIVDKIVSILKENEIKN